MSVLERAHPGHGVFPHLGLYFSLHPEAILDVKEATILFSCSEAALGKAVRRFRDETDFRFGLVKVCRFHPPPSPVDEEFRLWCLEDRRKK